MTQTLDNLDKPLISKKEEMREEIFVTPDGSSFVGYVTAALGGSILLGTGANSLVYWQMPHANPEPIIDAICSSYLFLCGMSFIELGSIQRKLLRENSLYK